MSGKREGGLWRAFFAATRASYRAQHGARTVRAWESGNPKRIANLYGRRLFYRWVGRIANKLFHN